MTVVLILTICAVIFCFFQLYQFKLWRDASVRKDALPPVQAVAVHKDKPKKKGKRSPKKRSPRKSARK